MINRGRSQLQLLALTSFSLGAMPLHGAGGALMAQNAKIYEDKRRGVWYVQLYWKGGRYWRGHYDGKFKQMPHREMAERLAHAINADIEKKGPAFDPRQWFRTPGYEFQFDLYAEGWITRNRGRYAPSVKRQTERYVQMFIDHFGAADLREIRKADIILFLENGIPADWQPYTKHVVLGLLHKLFSDAHDQELIDRVPGFPKVGLVDKEVKWLTPEEQKKVLDEIPDRDRPIFIFMAAWGVRPGEARGLKWDCVDFENRRVTIKRTFSGAGCKYLQEYTKTRRIRYLPITDDLHAVLRPLRGIGGFVFRNSHGRPYTADLSRIWNNARERAGVPEVNLYQGTRHSFATQHLDKLELVQVALGHTTAVMTRRYQGINVDKLRQLQPQANHKRGRESD